MNTKTREKFPLRKYNIPHNMPLYTSSMVFKNFSYKNKCFYKKAIKNHRFKMTSKKTWNITNKNCKKVINANSTNNVWKISGVGASIYINNDQEAREDNIFYVKFIGILKVKKGEEFLQGNWWTRKPERSFHSGLAHSTTAYAIS